MNRIESDIEYRPAEEIKAYQELLLRKALLYLKKHSVFYRRMFDCYGIRIDRIRHIEDLVRIPFTEKRTFSSSTASSSVVRPKKSSTT